MRYWVFDLDGTLVDSFGHYFKILEDLIGQTLGPAEKKELVGLHSEDFFLKKLGADRAKEAMAILQQRGLEDTKNIQPFAHISSVFSFLSENQFPIAVWTNRDLASAQLILENTGLSSHVKCLVSGNCVAQRKPNPEGFFKIQKTFNCQINEMVMVGDHDYDIQAGRQAGAFSIRVSWHKYWEESQCSLANKQFFCDREFYSWLIRS